jgi:microcystin-dependent protein
MKHLAELAVGGFITDNYHHEWNEAALKERDAAIIAIAGDKTIITGVIVDSGNATAGVVTYNGKLYTFLPGALQATVTTKRVATDRPNAVGIPAAAYYEDIIEFGDDGLETFDFADLKRYYNNQPETKEIKIIGRNITNEELAGSGWFLANGANGTDNLVDRFFVGAGNEYVVGNTGGLKQVTLTEAQMPSHRHGMENGADSDVGTGWIAADGDQIGSGDLSLAYTKSIGGGQAHENRPPYYAVVAIQFIGI